MTDKWLQDFVNFKFSQIDVAHDVLSHHSEVNCWSDSTLDSVVDALIGETDFDVVVNEDVEFRDWDPCLCI